MTSLVKKSQLSSSEVFSSAASAALTCLLLGHKVDYTSVAENSGAQCVRCSTAILGWGDRMTRVAHTLSCFFFSHNYIRVAQRAAHNEYVCEKCGHPLLFEITHDPYSTQNRFDKRVNYGCGTFGHRVHVVETGSRTTEYACRCGHSFVKKQTALNVIRHPLKCVLFGHLIAMHRMRDAWAEYLCLRCGHPFCFRRAIKSVPPSVAGEFVSDS